MLDDLLYCKEVLFKQMHCCRPPIQPVCDCTIQPVCDCTSFLMFLHKADARGGPTGLELDGDELYTAKLQIFRCKVLWKFSASESGKCGKASCSIGYSTLL